MKSVKPKNRAFESHTCSQLSGEGLNEAIIQQILLQRKVHQDDFSSPIDSLLRYFQPAGWFFQLIRQFSNIRPVSLHWWIIISDTISITLHGVSVILRYFTCMGTDYKRASMMRILFCRLIVIIYIYIKTILHYHTHLKINSKRFFKTFELLLQQMFMT